MKSRRCAMSLIEVTLVVLVMGVLAAVAAPRFANSLRAMKLQAAAKQLAAHIDWIRAAAVNEGRTTTLACDNLGHSYASPNVDFSDRVGELLQVSLAHDFDAAFTLLADFDSHATLSFDFEGVPHANGLPLEQGRITLSSGSEQYTVIVSAGSGATEVRRGGPPTGNSGATEAYDPDSVDGASGATT